MFIQGGFIFMKRYFSCLLVLFLLILTSEGLMAQKANPPSDFKYDLNKEGTGVIIQGYKGEATDVIIPSSIEDFPVVGVDRLAFCRSNIVSVVIPDSVTDIYYFAFCKCEYLQKVTLPKKLRYIDYNCFAHCSSLKEIALPEGLKEIKSSSFCKSGLESITIPDSVLLIDDATFSGCKNLKTVTIGNGVQAIGGNAFSDCSALTTVTIGNGIKGILEDAFKGCSSLTSVNIGVEKIDLDECYYIDDHCYYSGYAESVFSGCSSLSLKERKKIRDTGYEGSF